MMQGAKRKVQQPGTLPSTSCNDWAGRSGAVNWKEKHRGEKSLELQPRGKKSSLISALPPTMCLALDPMLN
jgi:hypothetical protein